MAKSYMGPLDQRDNPMNAEDPNWQLDMADAKQQEDKSITTNYDVGHGKDTLWELLGWSMSATNGWAAEKY